MPAAYSVVALLSGALTVALLWPTSSLVALAAAPIFSSIVVLLTAMVVALRSQQPRQTHIQGSAARRARKRYLARGSKPIRSEPRTSRTAQPNVGVKLKPVRWTSP
jgi:hypothetical protein